MPIPKSRKTLCWQRIPTIRIILWKPLRICIKRHVVVSWIWMPICHGIFWKIWHLKQLLHILGVRIGVKHLITLIPIGEIRAILPNIQMVILVLESGMGGLMNIHWLIERMSRIIISLLCSEPPWTVRQSLHWVPVRRWCHGMDLGSGVFRMEPLTRLPPLTLKTAWCLISLVSTMTGSLATWWPQRCVRMEVPVSLIINGDISRQPLSDGVFRKKRLCREVASGCRIWSSESAGERPVIIIRRIIIHLNYFI